LIWAPQNVPNGIATHTLPNGNPDLAIPFGVVPPSATPKSVPLVVQNQQKMQKLDNQLSNIDKKCENWTTATPFSDILSSATPKSVAKGNTSPSATPFFDATPSSATPNDDISPSATPFFDATPSSATPKSVAKGNTLPSATPKSVPLVVQNQQKVQKLDNQLSNIDKKCENWTTTIPKSNPNGQLGIPFGKEIPF